MKNRYSVATLLILVLGLSAAAQAPVHSQTASNVNSSSKTTTLGVTLTNPSTAHHLIVVHITWDKQSRDITSVTDTKSNTYTAIAGSTVNWGTGANKYRSALYYAYDIAVSPAPLTITATLDNQNNGFIEIYASEYSNVLTTSDPLDQTNTVAGSGTSISSGNVNTEATNELIYGVAIGATDPITKGAGFNQRSSAQQNIVEDKSGGSSGTYSASFTGANQWVATVATFKPLVTLPVNLISFYAKVLQDNKVQVDWATGSETNNDHFDIEHSQDGFDWVAIGRVEAASGADAQQQYFFADVAPFPGVTYYRLKQVDRDGNSNISKTLTVHTLTQQTTAVKAYPNPANAFLFVEGAGQSITVFNTAGQQMPVRVNAANDSKTTLDLSSLPAGLYFLKTGNKSVSFYRQ
jgi:hypothetical protein